jgi:hypothetical protein
LSRRGSQAVLKKQSDAAGVLRTIVILIKYNNMPKIKKSDNDQSLGRLIIIIALTILVIIGGVYLYRSQNLQEPSGPVQPNGATGGNQVSVKFQGKTLASDLDYPVGVIDGVVRGNPDLSAGTISVEADILRIYPEAPIGSKTITVSVRNADVVIRQNESDVPGSYTIADITADANVSVGLVDSETNRDILTKHNFQAVRVTIFRP